MAFRTKVVILTILVVYTCDANDPSFDHQRGFSVPVFVNKVWPVHNPVETYRYYDFPFCRPDIVDEFDMTLGEMLRGDRIMTSAFRDIEFGRNVTRQETCTVDISEVQRDRLMEAIRLRYVYELQVGSKRLSVIVPFGLAPLTDIVNLCTHLSLRLGTNREADMVFEAHAECTEYTNIANTNRITYFHSVSWFESPGGDNNQYEFEVSPLMTALGLKYSLSSDASSPVHWMSIANSFILALMIVGLVGIILIRVVRADLTDDSDESTKFIESGSEITDSQSSGGYWKLVHGDVFRPPVHRMWICAAVGSGLQLLLVLSIIAVLGAVGITAYAKRGTLITTAVVLYMLSSAISGFVSARMYHRIGGVKWTWNILVTALFFTGPAFSIWTILNTVAISYNSTAAFPFAVIMQLFAMWGLVTLPLTILGGILGRHSGMKLVQKKPFPTRTNRLAREIPRYNFFASMKFQIMITGFITFWSIYIELKFIFQSIWTNHHVYKLYSVLVVSVILLLLLSTSLTLLFTYFHLNAENYKWWWRSFFSGSSIALFVYGYCVYYYINSIMDGFFQAIFFFLYSLLFVYALALMVGATSFISTYRFVWFIFSHVKAD
jgi:transmembrane 9 superfamily protein 1